MSKRKGCMFLTDIKIILKKWCNHGSNIFCTSTRTYLMYIVFGPRIIKPFSTQLDILCFVEDQRRFHHACCRFRDRVFDEKINTHDILLHLFPPFRASRD